MSERWIKRPCSVEGCQIEDAPWGMPDGRRLCPDHFMLEIGRPGGLSGNDDAEQSAKPHCGICGNYHHGEC